MKAIKNKSYKLQLSEYIFFLALFIIFISFLLFYLIDLQNIFNIRDYLFSIDQRFFPFHGHSFFFRHWGRNGGFAEIIQYLFLLSSIIISIFIAAYNRHKKNIFYFWLIMSIAFSLMLIEDAGEIRHSLRYYVQLIFNEESQMLYGSLFEFFYFFLLALIPISALIFYGKFLLKVKKTRIYMVIGFSFYFLAASLSHLGTFFIANFVNIKENFYDLLGERFYYLFLKIGDPNLIYLWENNDLKEYISHYILDSLIEENFEIIASAAFLSASISYLVITNNKNKIINKNV